MISRVTVDTITFGFKRCSVKMWWFIFFTSCRRCCSFLWSRLCGDVHFHVIMGAMASEITSLAIVYPTVYSSADQGKHQGSASMAFYAMNLPVTGEFTAQMGRTRKRFPFDDVIMRRDVSANGFHRIHGLCRINVSGYNKECISIYSSL